MRDTPRTANQSDIERRSFIADLESLLKGAQNECEKLKQQLEEEKQRIGHGVLEAKWLDPECHNGCQSLVIKQKLLSSQLREQRMREVLQELCDDWKFTILERDPERGQVLLLKAHKLLSTPADP